MVYLVLVYYAKSRVCEAIIDGHASLIGQQPWVSSSVILLMADILHHLWCMKPYK